MQIIPIAMIKPNPQDVHTYSRLSEPKEISEADFLNHLADCGKAGLVSLAPDGVSDPQLMTVYRGYIIWGSEVE